MSQRGAVTPLLMASASGFVIVALMQHVIGAAVVGHRQAAAAADLAALAGATAVQHGTEGCPAAAAVAALNHARVSECSVTAQVVTVRVQCPLPRMFGQELIVEAQARAGPQ